jgi:hypothetical protein
VAGDIDGGAIIKENQSMMRDIIRIWSELAKDDDLGVRITTLLATVVGFACIAAFSLFVLVLIVNGSELVLHRLMVGTFILLVLFFFDGSVIAFRASQRAPIRQLEKNFEEVARHRYGEDAVGEAENG